MAHPITRAGGHVLFATGEKGLIEDINDVGLMALQSICNGLAAQLFQGADGNPINGFFGDGCKVTASGLTATIPAGYGIYYDTTATDEFGLVYRPIVVPVATTQAIDAHHATNRRYDLISLAPATDDDQSATRNVKNPSTLVVSSTNVDKRRRLYYTLTYTAGTPAATPADPATPAGHIAIARIRVPAAAGAVSVDDLRPKLQIAAQAASEPPSEYASSFIPGSSTELAVTEDPDGASMRVVVASGSAVIAGYRYRYGRTELTISTADATNPRYDLIVADTDGTVKVKTGTPAGTPVPPTADTDQVALAQVSVPAADTTIANSQITDQRVREPYSGTHIRDNTILAEKMYINVRPIRAALTDNPEAANNIDIDVQVQDGDGNDITDQRTFLARIYDAEMQPLGASPTVALTENGAGAPVSNQTNTDSLIFQTDANGVAQIRAAAGATTGTFYVVVEPFDYPGIKTYVEITFS
jgi:hypothetical protein